MQTELEGDMSTLKTAALAAAFVLCAVPGAFAAGSNLQLIIGGEAYEGPPKFEVTFDGRVLGGGAVNAAIDTATAGRFADAADKTPYVQSFAFDIPEEMFKPSGEVRVRLVNEAYGGDGSNRDRNLYLAAVAVNGRAVTVSGLSTQGTSSDTQNELLGEFLVLRDGNVEGVSRAPTGGWPLPDATIAAAQPAPEAVTTEVAAVAEEPTPVITKPPVAVRALRLPKSAEEKESDETPVETASLAATATPAVNPACDRDELYNVVGFNENSNDLTPKLMERLDQIVADIGEQECKVLVTGYSSRQGNHATNALFAIERAQNVLVYLKQAGLKFEKVSATGAGATEQFGDTFYANRRVVISVAP
jgi:outer membrane protein OmpA-like peptidoglycan-associated protein